MIIEGHDVEKANDGCHAILAGGGGISGLNGCPCDRRQACPDCPGVANETVPFLVPVPCLRPGQISRHCTIILGLKLPKSNNNSACSRRFFKSVKFLNQALNDQF